MLTKLCIDSIDRTRETRRQLGLLIILVFLGDFNAHHNQWLTMHRLTQLVDQTTRIPDIVGHGGSIRDGIIYPFLHDHP